MTRCPHGSGPPASCSLCAVAVPRRVTQRDGQLLVDGEPVRPVDTATPRIRYGTVHTVKARRRR